MNTDAAQDEVVFNLEVANMVNDSIGKTPFILVYHHRTSDVLRVLSNIDGTGASAFMKLTYNLFLDHEEKEEIEAYLQGIFFGMIHKGYVPCSEAMFDKVGEWLHTHNGKILYNLIAISPVDGEIRMVNNLPEPENEGDTRQFMGEAVKIADHIEFKAVDLNEDPQISTDDAINELQGNN